MENESKFLDENYLKVRLGEFKEIKEGQVRYVIEKSNRPNSVSLYIDFWVEGYHGATIRISDHLAKNKPDGFWVDFIIDPTQILTKKKKEKFVKQVSACIAKAKKVFFGKMVSRVGKQNETTT